MQFICYTKCLPNDGSFSGCSLCHAFSCQVMSDTTLVSSKHLSVSSSLLLFYVYFPLLRRKFFTMMLCVFIAQVCSLVDFVETFMPSVCVTRITTELSSISLSLSLFLQPLTKIEFIQFRLNISQGIYFPSFSTRSLSFSLYLNDSLISNSEVKKKKQEKEIMFIPVNKCSRESEKCLLDDDVTEHVFLPLYFCLSFSFDFLLFQLTLIFQAEWIRMQVWEKRRERRDVGAQISHCSSLSNTFLWLIKDTHILSWCFLSKEGIDQWKSCYQVNFEESRDVLSRLIQRVIAFRCHFQRREKRMEQKLSVQLAFEGINKEWKKLLLSLNFLFKNGICLREEEGTE